MPPESRTPPPDRLFAALLTLGYLLAGLVWIGFSDQAGRLLFDSPAALTRFQTWKGAGFVAASALLLYAVARQSLRRRLAPPPAGAAAWAVGLPTLLAGLVLVTAVPLVALMADNILRQTRSSVAETNAVAQRVAGSTSAEALVFLEEHRRLAAVLAARPAVVALDGSRCDPLLAEVPSLHGAVQNVIVLDARGAALCAARAGPHVPVLASRLRAGDWPLLVAPHTGEGALALTTPIRGADGSVAGGLQLLLHARSLAELVAGGAPPGVTNALLTLDAELLARSPPVSDLVGQRTAGLQRFVDAMRRNEDRMSGAGLDGVERFFALQRVPGWNVAVAVGVPVEGAYAPVRRAALRSLAGAALVLLVASLLIAAITRRIAGPIRALADAADAAAAGHIDRRAPEAGPREIAAVAVQFNRLLARLPQLERELHEKEEQHRLLLEKLSRKVPGTIFQVCMHPDGTGTVPFASEEGVRRMFATTPQAAGGDLAPLLAHVHPEDLPRLIARLRLAPDEPAPEDVAFPWRVILPGVGLRHYLTYAQAERQPGDRVLWTGCTVDVTPLQQAQAALREANETLEARVAERTRALAAANESLESFSYSIAHDLRAPLDAVRGFAAALPVAIERGDAGRVQRLVERIGANGAQMARMIDGLLALARSGKGEWHERAVPLEALVDEVLAQLPLAPGTQLARTPLPTVRGDPATLRQLWWNLLANAVKFSAQRTPPAIAIGWERGADAVVFSVRDNGAGFDPAHAGRLFTAFQRLHDATEFPGSGIGLALARRIVERHGGSIHAEAAPDAGACFWFTLPLARLLD